MLRLGSLRVLPLIPFRRFLTRYRSQAPKFSSNQTTSLSWQSPSRNFAGGSLLPFWPWPWECCAWSPRRRRSSSIPSSPVSRGPSKGYRTGCWAQKPYLIRHHRPSFQFGPCTAWAWHRGWDSGTWTDVQTGKSWSLCTRSLASLYRSRTNGRSWWLCWTACWSRSCFQQESWSHWPKKSRLARRVFYYRDEHAFVSGLGFMEDVEAKRSCPVLLLWFAPVKCCYANLEGNELFDPGLDLLIPFLKGVEF